ncbi:MAG: ribosomal L7Ae/L30e/S12e/Gadd45 family protein [Firmicutes bacterium]|nr:ribosomal L7Ae/L30e/S12e/Gadd45 family protein [Bacillota bacterium]
MAVYQRLKRQGRRTVGTSSTLRALRQRRLSEVYFPRDTDRRVINPLIALCKEQGVKINWVDSAVSLGFAVGLKISTSAVGFMREDGNPQATDQVIGAES